MDNDKTVLQKITDTLKDVARAATEAASEALKTDRPALKADERAVAYMPLAADGLVSDPLLAAPPVVETRANKKRAPKRSAKKSSKRAVTKAARKSAGKSVKKTAKKSTS
jgi:hypothetical protein